MSSRPRQLWIASVLATLITCELSAQTTTSGALTGVITDQTHAVVPNAQVDIRDSAKGTTQSAKTDREGLYHFFFLAPGAYALTVTHDGFREERRTVEILLGPPITVNLSLQIATTSSEIRVTDDVPLIKAENGDVSATMNSKQISEIPNQGNDLTNIVQIAPGVLMNTTGNVYAPFSILGMPGSSYLYTVDGLNNTENGSNIPLSGALAIMMGQNEVQEVSVVSTGYSGQFGGAAGGNINYITKSGSGQFHGNAQYYWNGTVLNSNDWFLKAFGVGRPPSIANQWAGSIGGPIKKEKLFFFADNEGLRVLVPQIFNVQIPSPQFEAATLAHIASDPRFGTGSATYSLYQRIFNLYSAAPGGRSAVPFTVEEGLGCSGFQDPNDPNGPGHGTVPCTVHYIWARGRPSQQYLTAGRVDWNVSRSDRAFLRVQYEGGHAALGIDPINPVFDFDQRIPWWQGQVIETHAFGSSGASQFMVGGASWFYTGRLVKPAQALAAFSTHLCFCGQGTYNDLGRNNDNDIYGIPLRFQISDDLMKTLGGHKFGFGGNFEAIHWDMWEYSVNANGMLIPQTLDAFYQGGVDPAVLNGTDSIDWTQLFQSFASKLSQRMAFHSFGIYGQDEWHARKNLSVTFALRAEHQSNPTCEHGCFVRLTGPFDSVSHDPNQPYNQALLTNQERAFIKMDTVLWSPRFSFAWQPLGVSHGTVLRGGIGVFYDSVPGVPILSFSGNPPNLNSYAVVNDNLAPGEKTNLFADAAASNTAFVNGFKSGQTLAQIKAGVVGFFPPGITLPDRVMHAPQYQKWSLELQQALGVRSSISVGYSGYHGIHGLIQNPSANAWGFGSLPAGRCPDPIPDCAPDPRFSSVTTISSPGISNYNGIVGSFQHRFSRWTSGLFQVNYTLGHALDEISNGGLFNFGHSSPPTAQDPKNLRRNYGPAEYDVRHSLNANYIWELPLKAALGGHGSNSVVTGWQVSGTVFARSGFPYSVFDGREMAIVQQRNFSGFLYAVPVGPLGTNPQCGKRAAFTHPVHPCQIPQTLPNGTPNPQARFVQAGCETGFDKGNLGPFPACDGPAVAFVQSKNPFRGPGYFNTDFTIMKNTKIHGWENASLGIGFQFFNLFNHPNFDTPVNDISDQFFGQIQGQNAPDTTLMGNNPGGLNARRLIQIKVQLQF